MLQAIRSRVGSWFIKILFALLVLSFAVWGIGDFLGDQGSDRTVIEVGDREITLRQFDDTFRTELNRLRQMFGPELDAATAIQLGLLDQTLDDLIGQAAVRQAASELGLRPPTAMIGEEIRRQPVFQDATGRFSRTRFLQVLQANNLTEEGYVALLSRELSQERVFGAVLAGAAAPSVLTEPLFAYHNQTRTAETVTLSDGVLSDLPEPTEQDLTSYHREHPERFSSPEYRVLSVLSLDARDMARDIAIDEAVLRDEYEYRLDEYSAPDRRRFEQAVVQDPDIARQIAQTAREDGLSLREVAAALGDTSIAVIDLDWTMRDELLGDFADAAFALAQGEISEPLESPFGWHVLEVTGVEDGRVQPFEEVREEVAFELQFDRALDAIFEMANILEDGLAAGLNLEQAAEDIGEGLRQTPPLAADGRVQGGGTPPGLTALNDILEVAYSLPRGEESRLIDTPDGVYFVVRVDEIVAPEVLPLDQVRDQVIAAWRAEQRAAALETLAEQVAQRLSDGATARSVAAESDGVFGETTALRRDGSNRGQLPAALIERLFAAAPGEVVQASANDGRRIVARLREIQDVDPVAAGDALSPLIERTRQAIAGDLVEQFTQALRDSQRVTVDRETIERYYR